MHLRKSFKENSFKIVLNILIFLPLFSLLYLWHTFINQHELIYKLPVENFDNFFKKEDGEVFQVDNYKVYKFKSDKKVDLVFFHGSIVSSKILYKNLKKISLYANVWTYLLPKFGNNEKITEFTLLKSAFLVGNFVKQRSDKLILFGQSLGCNLALFVSYQLNLPVILENPFFNGQSFFKVKMNALHRFLMSSQFKNDYYLSNLKNKVFIFSAETEDVIDKEDTLRLSKINCTKYFILKGTTHMSMGKVNQYFEKTEEAIKESFN
ncbi:monoacylglycerol lipase ABHD12-like [Tubulinosema ratisbonensis]|uniref:Monoacylglycerol lipase ABHD12-like n=1 Tax=Tubulinosema ratisbonensis TaxID=291195 RepID=A0A437AQF4_9MICR|nr:monoacylglycerol lipase ABHD12-like [Tubulinosema ratisbonensis]